MLRFTLLLPALALVACSAADTGPNRPQDVDTLRKLKLEEWPRIYREADAEALEAFLADEFVLIANGFTPKAQEVAWLSTSGGGGPEDFVYTIEDILFVTNDVAIVYGRGTSTRRNDEGQPCAHSYLSSNTLRRDGDTWRPVLSHVSDVQCVLVDDGAT